MGDGSSLIVSATPGISVESYALVEVFPNPFSMLETPYRFAIPQAAARPAGIVRYQGTVGQSAAG